MRSIIDQLPRGGSAMALALAALAGTAGPAALPGAAHAQETPAERKPDFSKNFVKAAQAVQQAMQEGAQDWPAAKAALPAAVKAASTPDDRNTAGQLSYQIGNQTQDAQLTMQGLRMMVDSGVNPPETQGKLNWALYEQARNAGQMDLARAALQRAIDSNYSFQADFADGTRGTFGPVEMRVALADTYFKSNQPQQGVAYLQQQIDAAAANGKPPENLIRAAFAKAYENKMGDAVTQISKTYVQYYPSQNSWGDTIAVQRALFPLDDPAMLDLLRLARRTDALRNERDYTDYLSVADPIRMPTESGAVAAEGVAAGQLPSDSRFVAEARQAAGSRSESEKADLPGLVADARKANANADLVLSAANTSLSLGSAQQAEELYRLALDKPGVDRNLVLTRMGIAQVDQGKYDAAEQTFAQVQGDRGNLAQLWSVYAQQKAGGSADVALAS